LRRYCQWELTAAWLAGEATGKPERRILVINPESGVAHIQPEVLTVSPPAPTTSPGPKT
jgi:hypothetical protein